MKYLLYHRGYETGELLLDTLNAKGLQFKGVTNPDAIRNVTNQDFLVRWGNSSSQEIDQLFGPRRVMNLSAAIRRNTNKLLCFDIFRQAGIQCPKVYRTKHEITTFPVLGRDINHRSGLDIVIIDGSNRGRNDMSKVPNKDFYVEFLKSSQEFRVHVFDGQVVRVTRKVFRGVNKDGQVVINQGKIKNDIYGWGHANVNIENVSQVYKNICINAVKAIGLDFGAVDLLIDLAGRPFALEINTCPSLNQIGLDIYSGAIESRLNVVTPKPKRKYFW